MKDVCGINNGSALNTSGHLIRCKLLLIVCDSLRVITKSVCFVVSDAMMYLKAVAAVVTAEGWDDAWSAAAPMPAKRISIIT